MEKAAEALGHLDRPEARDALEASPSVKNEDERVNLREAEALARCGRPKGMAAVIRMAAEADAGLIRAEALKKAIAFAGRPAKSVEGAEGKAALADLSAWWKGAREGRGLPAAAGFPGSAGQVVQ